MFTNSFAGMTGICNDTFVIPMQTGIQ